MSKKGSPETPRKFTLQRRNLFPASASSTLSARTRGSAARLSASATSSHFLGEHASASGDLSSQESSPGPQTLLYLEDSEDLFLVSKEEESQPLSQSAAAPSPLIPTAAASSSNTPSTPISSQSQSSASSQGGAPGQQQQQSQMVRPRGSLWRHFTCVDDDPRLAMCSVCAVVVRRGTDPKHLSSSALRSHLQRHHPRLLTETGNGRKRGVGEEGEKEAEVPAKKQKAGGHTTEGGQSGRQATLQDVLPLSGVQRMSQRARARAQETTNRVLGEMVAMTGVPLSFVESPGFLHFLKHALPNYQPPSRRTLSRRVMPDLQESVREMVRAQLDRAKGRKIHFTSDLWSSTNRSYLSLTAHWWQPEDAKGEEGVSEACGQGEGLQPSPGYRVALLQACSMEGSATGRNIAEEFESALREWAPEGRVKRGHMVTDAGRNMLLAVRTAGLEGIVCLAHKIHLVMGNALGLGSEPKDSWGEGTLETRALLEKCRKLVGHFSRSVKAARQLHEQQEQLGIAEHVLLIDVTTRWNSTFEMVSRLVEQKSVLEEIMSTTPILPGGRELDISANDWLALSQMVDVLKPFEDTTKAICSQEASLGLVIPFIRSLDRVLQSFLGEDSTLLPRIKTLVERLQDGVRKRLHPLYGHRVYQLACLCDPTVKGSLASSPAELQTWKEDLSLEVRRAMEAQGWDALPGTQGSQVQPRAGSSQESCQSVPTSRRSRKSPFVASVITWAVSTSAEQRPVEDMDPAEAMVTQYMSAPLLAPLEDTLSYWASKVDVWPQLSGVAMDLLSIPPTSVESERVFSQLGEILRPRRSRLDPATVERLAFIRFNLSMMGSPSYKK